MSKENIVNILKLASTLLGKDQTLTDQELIAKINKSRVVVETSVPESYRDSVVDYDYVLWNTMAHLDLDDADEEVAQLCRPEITVFTHEDLPQVTPAWRTPYLPSTEGESTAHAEAVGNYTFAVYHRVMLPPSLNDQVEVDNRYSDLAQSIRSWAEINGYDPDVVLAYPQVFAYPFGIYASQVDLERGLNPSMRTPEGDLVEVEALQPGSYSVAVAPIETEDVVIYTNPGEGAGIIRSRLIPEATEGHVTISFALNPNVDTLSSPDDVYRPAIHINGYPFAPVKVLYQIPNDETVASQGKEFDEVTIEARLSDKGDLSIELPSQEIFYQDNYATAVTVSVVEASSEDGEGGASFRIGTDDDSLGKNRIEREKVEDMIIQQRSQ